MKKFVKFGCFGFIALLVLIIIIAAFTVKVNAPHSRPSSDTAKESEEKATEEQADPQKNVLTEKKLNKINNGMTYEQIVQIIGTEGTLITEVKEKNDSLTQIYQFPTDGFLTNALFTFHNNKLSNKDQISIQDENAPQITLEQFNQIQNGMTLEQVTDIVGGEGSILSEYGKGTDQYKIVYTYSGQGRLGANARLTFQNNKLVSKSQNGLK
ncbi:DUF3862 domain-containing protein [Bacillus testis]|uniref:DUF3862 domain-containing protein n=1 Tax=Bacillus testis TaxID=1622072 RepID=UPI00067F3516|nr:DUF3862 domain-containing protein [Bacillus testis]